MTGHHQKTTSNSRGILSLFWRFGENDLFFQNAQNAGAVFPPTGSFSWEGAEPQEKYIFFTASGGNWIDARGAP